MFAVGCLKHPTVRDGVIIAFTTVWGSVYGVRSTEYPGMHASERIYRMMMAFCMLHKFRVTFTTVATVINIITAEDGVAAACEICRMYGNHPCSAVHHATPRYAAQARRTRVVVHDRRIARYGVQEGISVRFS